MDDIVTYADAHPGAYFRINGVDILRFLKKDGLKWQRNDVDSSKSGRSTMNGVMHRARVAQKFRADMDCIPLYRADELMLMQLINPAFVEVETNLHPLYEYHIAQYYSNNVPATVSIINNKTGVSLWTGITFPLIEQ